MKSLGYIRVSTEQQDADKQKNLLLEYAHTHKIMIHEFITVEISSRKSSKERKIDLLCQKLQPCDQLLIAGRTLTFVTNVLIVLKMRWLGKSIAF